MPNVSVKLPDQTKARLDALAARRGTSPHAFMVQAIESGLDREEQHDSFVRDAQQSRDQMVASGKAFDGDEVIAYLRARGRGERPARPRAKALKTLLKPGK